MTRHLILGIVAAFSFPFYLIIGGAAGMREFSRRPSIVLSPKVFDVIEFAMEFEKGGVIIYRILSLFYTIYFLR
jgi:hypothetical protein